jgi:hypothetical protein
MMDGYGRIGSTVQHSIGALMGICTLAVVSCCMVFLPQPAIAGGSGCGDHIVCFWKSSGFNGDKVVRSGWPVGQWWYITEPYATWVSAKNHFANRFVKVQNTNGYGGVICLNPGQHVSSFGFGEDQWKQGKIGSRC